MKTNISRRHFLKHSGAFSAAAGVGMPMVMNLAMPGSASAATSTGYKALVCVYLAGGNDAHNTVIRTDKGLARFMAARANVGGEVIAVDTATGALSPRNPLPALTVAQNKTGIAGLSLALHPRLVKVKTLFADGKLAIIGNIGPLTAPTTVSDYQSGTPNVPPKLFSHNDQTSIWQSGQPEGATSGWGGELVRRYAQLNSIGGVNSQLLSAVAIESSPVFLAGISTKMPDNKPLVAPFGASRSQGALRPGGLDRSDNALPTDPYYVAWSIPRNDVLTEVFNGTVGRGETVAGAVAGNLIEADYLSKVKASNDAWIACTAALATVPASGVTVPADNSLAAQLAMVAKLIKSSTSASLAYGRQVFFVQLGGFDTHSGQVGNNNAHARLLGQLDDALAYFDAELGADRSKVVTFTASEFGRKLNENGDGSDHGWGGHHFVMGGGPSSGLTGGVYGYFPDMSTWNSTTNSYGATEQLLADGVLVPSVPVYQLAAQLGKWLGIDWTSGTNVTVASQLFPNLGAFPAKLTGLA
jgi:uncharacterized protein (DUF1501 family)